MTLAEKTTAAKREKPAVIVEPADDKGNVAVRVAQHRATMFKDVRDTVRVSGGRKPNDTRDPAIRAQEYGDLIARMMHKPGKPRGLNNPSRLSRSTDSDIERQAITYAKWLAKRGGVQLPTTGTGRLDWSGVYVAQATGREVYAKRICGVQWGRKEEVYSTRKNGRQGAYLYTKFVEEFRIDFPNWDWVPAPAIEETITDVVGADAIAA